MDSDSVFPSNVTIPSNVPSSDRISSHPVYSRKSTISTVLSESKVDYDVLIDTLQNKFKNHNKKYIRQCAKLAEYDGETAEEFLTKVSQYIHIIYTAFI